MDQNEFINKYVVERRGTDSQKWDELKKRYGDENLISMWVADMEFKTSEKIIEAMNARCLHGVFGYSYASDGYYQAFSNWMETRHHFRIEKEWVRFSTGVVAAINWMIQAFTKPGDACLILTPVYYPFHSAVKNNQRNLVTVDLENHHGYFTMDFEAIENAIVEQNVKMFIQCSPHNPVGRVWTEEELDAVLRICKKHNVLVVSDEIHQDLIIGDKKFIPAAIVSEGIYRDRLITLSSASKTFNIAALIHSHIVITYETLRKTYDEYALKVNMTETNLMGITATEAGYRYGGPWLGHVLEIIKANYAYLKREFNQNAPGIVVSALEGTYLVFLDLRKYVQPDQTKAFIQEKCKLAVSYGENFGEHFKGFIRLNLATDPKFVELAVQTIVREIREMA